MMAYLYTLSIEVYVLLIRVAAWLDPKAKRWWEGRRNWAPTLQAALAHKRRPEQPLIWVHCASLGEFEQGRPLIEALKKTRPEVFILLTFFSPSGYDIRKNYPHADHICYLPADLPRQVRRFLDLTQPQLAIFVKYEFWYNYLRELQHRATPIWLIAALFRPQQVFFQYWGTWFFRILRGFSHFFVQNEASAALLQRFGLTHYTLAGDPRVDRVLQIAAEARSFPNIEAFVQAAPVLVAGSTWAPDETRLAELWNHAELRNNWKLILAPHEIHPTHLEQIEQKFAGTCIRYSQLDPLALPPHANVLIIDNIGMLAALYKYATLAYIGGGFGAGIHNTLEPMAFGLPVIFGPKYHKFTEALANVQQGGAFAIQDTDDLVSIFSKLQHRDERKKAQEAVSAFLAENRGATEKILRALQQHEAL